MIPDSVTDYVLEIIYITFLKLFVCFYCRTMASSFALSYR